MFCLKLSFYYSGTNLLTVSILKKLFLTVKINLNHGNICIHIFQNIPVFSFSFLFGETVITHNCGFKRFFIFNIIAFTQWHLWLVDVMALRWQACCSAPWPWTGTFNLYQSMRVPSLLSVVTANAEVSRRRRLCPKQLAVSVRQLSAVCISSCPAWANTSRGGEAMWLICKHFETFHLFITAHPELFFIFIYFYPMWNSCHLLGCFPCRIGMFPEGCLCAAGFWSLPLPHKSSRYLTSLHLCQSH